MEPTRLSILIVLATFAAGCVTALDPSQTPALNAHGVSITATPDPTQFAGMGFKVRMENIGGAPVFLTRCGDVPAVQQERFENGIWVQEGTHDDCALPTSPGPLSLAAGANIEIIRSVSIAGTYRYTLMVGSTSSMNDIAQARSASFEVR